MVFIPPDPILDRREEALLGELTERFQKLTSHGYVTKAVSRAGKKLRTLTPERFRALAQEALDAAAEWEIVKRVMDHAGRGFAELSAQASRFTLSHDGVLTALRSSGVEVSRFEEICAARSYRLEPVVRRRDFGDLAAALAEGVATGAPGLLGVPFNIALSFFLYFRAVQGTALYYGYDIKGDPREIEFASATTIACFSPQTQGGEESLSGIFGKMMLAANLSALRRALAKSTYTEMARRGGSQLLYVQIRALANKAAERALQNAGQKGLEATVFRDLVEQLGRQLPKQAGKKAVPLLGAVIGGLSDSYYMSRVLRIANLTYHKRFLFEKEHRVELLLDGNGPV
jgi:hypothetical protein